MVVCQSPSPVSACLPDPLDECRARVILGVAADMGAAAVGGDKIALGNRLGGVVGSLGVNVRAETIEEPAHMLASEDHDEINGSQAGDQLRSLGLGKEGAARALEPADGGVRVDPHDEEISLAAGVLQVAEVPDVEQVEGAIGEHDGSSFPPHLVDPPLGLLEIDHSPAGALHGWFSSGCVSTARRSSSRETVAVPCFMTTMPPA